MSTFTPLFTKHSREWRENRYVYPVISRRSRGLSIGVNLNPDKVCNFDCIYCCVDRSTMPGKVEVDLSTLRIELSHMLDLYRTGELFAAAPLDATPPELRRLNDIAFSGDGEPTSFGHFQEVCAIAAELLAEKSLDAKLVVITNATLFHQPRVQKALKFLDQHKGELWAKLDAGTEAYFKLVERTGIPFARVLENIRAAGTHRPIVIQTLLMNIHKQPPPEAEIDAYIARLCELVGGGCQIKLVQIYTVARGTAEAFATPLDAKSIDAISARVRAETKLNVETYYGPT